MSDFPTTDHDSTTGFDLDEAVDSNEEDFEVETVEADDVEDVEGDESETNEDGTPKPNRGIKRRKEEEAKVDPSEFAFDGTPRPRQPGSGEKKAPGVKRDFQPIPDGWMTPTQLRNHLFDTRVVNTSSQAVYGMVKNGSKFPYKTHTDGRYIVPVEDETAQAAGDELANGPSEIGAKTWVINAFQKRAERNAEKEAAAAKAAEGQSESEDATDAPADVVTEDVIG
jgi:hypothetical protein